MWAVLLNDTNGPLVQQTERAFPEWEDKTGVRPSGGPTLSPRMKHFLFWLPRILAVFYIGIFIAFALAVFDVVSSVPFLYRFVAFLIHLIPSILLFIFLVIAWRFEKAGGILFLLFGVGLAIVFQNLLLTNLSFLILPLIIGVLFLFHNSKAF